MSPDPSLTSRHESVTVSNPLLPTIQLTKHHGLANDFLVALEPSRSITPDDVRQWCHRHTGIGADGLMVATPASNGGSTAWAMTLYNADGSEAEISGNGIRCLAQAIADRLGHDRRTDLELDIDSGGRVRRCTVLASPLPDAGVALDVGAVPDAGAVTTDAGAVTDADTAFQAAARTPGDQVRVGMGKVLAGPPPSSRWPEVGIDVDRQIGVDIGNPHVVAFVSAFGEADMAEIGPVIEADYPQGCNIHLVRVDDGNRLVMKIWERGAGVTQACGSGASAAAWAAVQAGLVDASGSLIPVAMPGGSAQVQVDGDEVVLIGPAVRIAGIEIA